MFDDAWQKLYDIFGSFIKFFEHLQIFLSFLENKLNFYQICCCIYKKIPKLLLSPMNINEIFESSTKFFKELWNFFKFHNFFSTIKKFSEFKWLSYDILNTLSGHKL